MEATASWIYHYAGVHLSHTLPAKGAEPAQQPRLAVHGDSPLPVPYVLGHAITGSVPRSGGDPTSECPDVLPGPSARQRVHHNVPHPRGVAAPAVLDPAGHDNAERHPPHSPQRLVLPGEAARHASGSHHRHLGQGPGPSSVVGLLAGSQRRQGRLPGAGPEGAHQLRGRGCHHPVDGLPRGHDVQRGERNPAAEGVFGANRVFVRRQFGCRSRGKHCGPTARRLFGRVAAPVRQEPRLSFACFPCSRGVLPCAVAGVAGPARLGAVFMGGGLPHPLVPPFAVLAF
eukprot:jgi/Botrbrau1/21908/Bobra.0249s0036.1